MVWAFIFSLLLLASVTGPYFAHTLLPSVLMAATFSEITTEKRSSTLSGIAASISTDPVSGKEIRFGPGCRLYTRFGL